MAFICLVFLLLFYISMCILILLLHILSAVLIQKKKKGSKYEIENTVKT